MVSNRTFRSLILVGALLPQVLFTIVSQAQKNLILNPGFEKLNLIRFGPTFIDGQFYDGLRYFDHGLSVVHDTDGLRRALDSINQLEHKNCRLMVLGYTDGTGNAAQNAALSLDRARTVSQMILDIYPTKRLSYAGEGSLDATPLANPSHRRADVYLIDCK